MKTTDLSDYNLAELKGLQQDIDRQINGRQQYQLQQARQQILAIAHTIGLSVDELFAASGKKATHLPRQKVAAQYQHPGDSSITWTGRGRQPRWVVEALANGKTLADLRIAR